MDLIVSTDAGLYCPAGDFYIDPARGVPRAVITHAHADHARSGSKHYWCAAPGYGPVRARLGSGGGITAVEYGQHFTLGEARVSLHPAGHVLGSAQVRVEVGGKVWVLSGDYKRERDPTCLPFEPQRCDVFITEATFALPAYAWPDPAEVAQDLFDWWQQAKREGQCALLCAYALGKAQRILAELLRHTNETVYLHDSITPLVKLYRQQHVAMLPTEPVAQQPKFFDWRGRLVLAPPGVAGTPWIKRFQPCSLGFASGWMGVRGTQRRQWDRGFILSDHADWNGLLRSIEDTGARRVIAMHGHTEMLIDVLRARGIEASRMESPVVGAQRGLDAAKEAAA